MTTSLDLDNWQEAAAAIRCSLEVRSGAGWRVRSGLTARGHPRGPGVRLLTIIAAPERCYRENGPLYPDHFMSQLDGHRLAMLMGYDHAVPPRGHCTRSDPKMHRELVERAAGRYPKRRRRSAFLVPPYGTGARFVPPGPMDHSLPWPVIGTHVAVRDYHLGDGGDRVHRAIVLSWEYHRENGLWVEILEGELAGRRPWVTPYGIEPAPPP